MSRPLFLLTNDDGITARGLQELARALSHIADICVVAPDTVRSGMSQAVTSAVPLRIEEYKKGTTPYPQYAVNGTPADCVKLALYHVLHRRPDMVIAGINHGSNASVNVLYSGTMGATLEGCIAGFPSIGFSLVNRTLDADLSPYLPWCEKIVRTTLEHGLPQGVALNVNLPRRQVQGIRVCRQTGGWVSVNPAESVGAVSIFGSRAHSRIWNLRQKIRMMPHCATVILQLYRQE